MRAPFTDDPFLAYARACRARQADERRGGAALKLIAAAFAAALLADWWGLLAPLTDLLSAVSWP